MPYRLTLDEPELAGLTRVAREEVKSAIAELRKGEAGVHEARKSIKKIRAILRLLKRPANEHDPLREMADRLAASRDAAAMQETVATLRRDFAGYPAVKLLHSIPLESTAAKADLHTAGLVRFQRGIALWKTTGTGFDILAPGLRATYRQGRRALAQARTHPSSEAFHELRKRVKDHWYHVRLLSEIWPGPMEAREKCLKDLQERLGDDHNLAVLQTHTASERVWELIARAQSNLRQQALPVAEKIYAAKTKDHLRLLRRLWDLSHPA